MRSWRAVEFVSPGQAANARCLASEKKPLIDPSFPRLPEQARASSSAELTGAPP